MHVVACSWFPLWTDVRPSALLLQPAQDATLAGFPDAAVRHTGRSDPGDAGFRPDLHQLHSEAW